jgi:hypothetical protein
MLIAELVRNAPLTIELSPYSPFVFSGQVRSFTWDATATDIFGAGSSENVRTNVKQITRDYINKYLPSDTLNDCLAQEGSFFYDHDSQEIYIHMEHDYAPYMAAMEYGFAFGMTDQDVTYIDDYEYLPLIESLPNLEVSADALNATKITGVSGTAKLKNKASGVDGPLDFLINENVYGNDFFVYSYDPETGTKTATACLFIEKPSYTLSGVTLDLQDKRKSQNVKIPTAVLDKGVYPYLADTHVGKIIPLVYGHISEMLVTPINSEESKDSSTILAKYRMPDGMSNIGTAYVWLDDTQTWTPATTPVADYVTGILTIGNGRTSNGTTRKLKLVGCTGILINGHSYPADIIVDLNRRFLGLQYNAINYDLAEWAAESASSLMTADIGFVLDSRRELYEVIFDITNKSKNIFRYEFTPENKISIRVRDFDRAVSGYVESCDIHNRDELPIDADPGNVFASVVIKYAHNYVEDSDLSLENLTHYDEVVSKYRTIESLPLETWLTNEADASARAAADALMCSDVPHVVKLDLFGFAGLKIFDTLDAALVVDDLYSDSRSYFGIRKVLVLSIDPDSSRGMMHVTALVSPTASTAERKERAIASAYTYPYRENVQETAVVAATAAAGAIAAQATGDEAFELATIADEYFETRYRRAASAPATPTDADPAGWTVAVPADDGNPLWQIGAPKRKSTGELLGTWYAPLRFTNAATVVGVLTNDAHRVPCDVDGNNPNFTGAVSELKIWEGATDTTAQWAKGKTDGAGITSTISSGIVTITALSVDASYVDLTATRNGVTVTKRFTVTKARQGDSTPAYYMSVSSPVVLVKPDQSRNPSTITFLGKYQTGLSAPQAYNGIWKLYVNGTLQVETGAQSSYEWDGFGDILLDNSTEIPYEYTPGVPHAFLIDDTSEILLPYEYSGSDALAYMTAEMWDTAGTVLLDSQTITFIADWDNYRDSMLGEVPSYAPSYLGPHATHPTWRKGDWWVIYDASPYARGVYYAPLDGGSPYKIDGTVAGQGLLIATALPDILWAIRNGHGVSSDYGAVTYIQYLIADAIAAGYVVIGQDGVTGLVADLAAKETPAGAQSKASTAQSTAISTAAADATSKASAAQSSAIAAASSDATTKANAAELAAKNLVAQKLGYADYAALAAAAAAGHTIIDGGYIRTILLDVVALLAQEITLDADGHMRTSNYAETGGKPTAGFILDAANNLIKAYAAVFNHATMTDATVEGSIEYKRVAAGDTLLKKISIWGHPTSSAGASLARAEVGGNFIFFNFLVACGGVYRVKATAKVTQGTGYLYFRRNGSDEYNATLTGSEVTYSYDMTVEQGDDISLWLYTSVGNYQIYVSAKDFSISVDPTTVTKVTNQIVVGGIPAYVYSIS